jgi:RNA polymerase sigma-70 factor (ECF subfamily)
VIATLESPSLPAVYYGKLDSIGKVSMGSETPQNDITLLLVACRNGEAQAESQLLELIYHELRSIARHQMRRESPGHTLQPTALVNEAYLRLFGSPVDWQNRAQFFSVAARTMRRILVDHARSRHSQKRSGGKRIELDHAMLVSVDRIEDVLALDQALQRLAERDDRQAKLVELRFFAGLSIEEAAKMLGICSRTAKRDWDFAQAWLFREMHPVQNAGN